MKKYIYTVAFFALCLAATGCQKENLLPYQTETQQNMSKRDVSYSIDGINYHTTFYGEQEWLDFLERMAALARNGHRVSFRNESASTGTSASKEVVVYSTSVKEDAVNWCNMMAEAGYEVTMEYDPRTGNYICTAVN